MSTAGPLLPGERQAMPEPKAPPLPLEAPCVTAAVALTAARDQVGVALWLIQNEPRSDATASSVEAALQRIAEAHRAFATYRQILACEGSA